MRILLIHQYYVKGDAAGGSRWNEMTKVWRKQGHDITVIAGMYSFQLGANYPEYRGRLFQKEVTPDGITVHRVFTPSNYDRNFFWRAMAYFCFVFLGAIAGLFQARKHDVIVASSPPLTVGPLGAFLSIATSTKLVFEIRDLWPESAVDTGVLTNPRLIRILEWMEALSYRAATRINALTPAFVKALVERKGIPAEKVWMIPNGADIELVRPGPRENHIREKHNWGDKFVGLYIGAFGRANYLWQLIDAAEILKDDPRFVIACVGNGMERDALETEVLERGLDNIQFLPAVDKAEISYYLNACDVSLVVLKKVDTFKTVYPNKMFDSMSAERAIILAIDGAARTLVEQNAQCGVYVEPENSAEIVDAMRSYRSSPDRLAQHGRNGLDYVRGEFDRRKLAAKYLRLIQEEVCPRSRIRGRV